MNMTHKLTPSIYIILILMLNIAFTSNVYADDCLRLAEIASWNEGMALLNAQMTQQRWNEALKTTENLNAICDRSPILNYAIGRIYKEIGNDSKALYYMQRATLFTEEFQVKGKTLEKMWFDRYEAEYPEARPEAIEARKKELEELRANAQKSHINAQIDEQTEQIAHRSHYAAGLWTGVAVGAVGLALTVTGGVLAFKESEKNVDVHKTKEGKTVAEFDNGEALYLGLFGAGIAMTITGAIFSGIFGYHYAHITSVNDLSFDITPNSMSLSLNF